MCGILGIVNGKEKNIEGFLHENSDILKSRGPDGKGYFKSRNVGLAHRRLSIIDLSSTGHQPMMESDERFVMVYNGEIYNYQEVKNQLAAKGYNFIGTSDSEVVLKAYKEWRAIALNKFNGMFAIAIWDRQKQELFLARDRLGIKPIYYGIQDEKLVFASRLSCISSLGEKSQEISYQSLSYYMQLGFVPQPHTIYNDIFKLPAGHFLKCTINDLKYQRQIKPQRYWSLSSKRSNGKSYANSSQAIDDLLHDSIKKRLIADVPVGLFLSGGIDSSLVAGIASEYTDNLQAFSIGFREEKFNELEEAKLVAQKYGLDHKFKLFDSKDLLSHLDTYFSNFDQPYADASALPTMLVSQLAANSVKVVLSGDGGDELFGGYPVYQYLNNIRYLYKLPRSIRALVLSPLNYAGHRSQILYDALNTKCLRDSAFFMRSYYKKGNLPFKKSVNQNVDLINLPANPYSYDEDVISSFSKFDLKYYLTDDILHKVDISSMAYSLEVRVPILDHRIVEFAMGLPSTQKVNGFRGKKILKEVASNYLPKEILNKSKSGFGIPISKWIKTDLKELFFDELTSSSFRDIDFIDHQYVQQMLEHHIDGKKDYGNELWIILNFAKWYKK